MSDALTLIDMFARGIAAGVTIVLGLGLVFGGQGRQARLAGGVMALSIACWIVVESHALWRALGLFYPLTIPAHAVAAFFWLFVLAVFDDRPLTLSSWIPAALLIGVGIVGEGLFVGEVRGLLWAGRNVFSLILLAHAAYVIISGWSGDLLESRRRVRVPILGLAAFFGLTNVFIALAHRLNPHEDWLLWTVGYPYGGILFAGVVLLSSIVFLQARTGMFGGARREQAGIDARAEAADRVLTERLNGLMAEGAWRREGLTIGALARELGEPEYRLRRLINQRLGHRNFADFVNGYRIEAAKVRLADPAEARTTVAAIAFDLGYGSLGPFNRAFRAATGATPTEWRRESLRASPELQEAV